MGGTGQTHSRGAGSLPARATPVSVAKTAKICEARMASPRSQNLRGQDGLATKPKSARPGWPRHERAENAFALMGGYARGRCGIGGDGERGV
jgi:hypothetical protein